MTVSNTNTADHRPSKTPTIPPPTTPPPSLVESVTILSDSDVEKLPSFSRESTPFDLDNTPPELPPPLYSIRPDPLWYAEGTNEKLQSSPMEMCSVATSSPKSSSSGTFVMLIDIIKCNNC